MSFEIKEEDLLARIGRLKTKSKIVETPLLFPVINPAYQLVSPGKIGKELGFEALITNAYILKQRFQNQPVQRGLHKFLGFNGAIMTDSGAYQILVYGDVKTNPKEIVEYQERIDSDIATILDIPTGWKITEKQATQTVNETLKRAKQFFRIRSRNDILWVGPIQGGRHLRLVAKSAKEMQKLPFQIHALGSPTEVMESYRFDVLADMILTTKINLPPDRPLHLFGAGHPLMFSFAVATGCDMFDSAAYALYARERRYMTENGTHRLSELDYFPCACPKCSETTPKQVLERAPKEIEAFLAEHNLYVCSAEIRKIKQAIRDGRLWEHTEMRAHSHPALLTAIKRLAKYKSFIEKHSPSVKPSGLFFYNSLGLIRPEVIRHQKLLTERYTPPNRAETLLLFPQTSAKPFHKSHEYKKAARNLKRRIPDFHTCFYAAPFGTTPIELDEIYPLSQHEIVTPLDKETKQYVAEQARNYVKGTNYKTVILINDPQNWNNTVANAVKRTCKQKHIILKTIHIREILNAKPK